MLCARNHRTYQKKPDQAIKSPRKIQLLHGRVLYGQGSPCWFTSLLWVSIWINEHMHKVVLKVNGLLSLTISIAPPCAPQESQETHTTDRSKTEARQLKRISTSTQQSCLARYLTTSQWPPCAAAWTGSMPSVARRRALPGLCLTKCCRQRRRPSCAAW